MLIQVPNATERALVRAHDIVGVVQLSTVGNKEAGERIRGAGVDRMALKQAYDEMFAQMMAKMGSLSITTLDKMNVLTGDYIHCAEEQCKTALEDEQQQGSTSKSTKKHSIQDPPMCKQKAQHCHKDGMEAATKK